MRTPTQRSAPATRTKRDGAMITRIPEKVVQTQIVALLRTLGADVYVLGTTRPRGDRHHGTYQSQGKEAW